MRCDVSECDFRYNGARLGDAIGASGDVVSRGNGCKALRDSRRPTASTSLSERDGMASVGLTMMAGSKCGLAGGDVDAWNRAGGASCVFQLSLSRGFGGSRENGSGRRRQVGGGCG